MLAWNILRQISLQLSVVTSEFGSLVGWLLMRTFEMCKSGYAPVQGSEFEAWELISPVLCSFHTQTDL
jgi:hypothetical protein